MVPIDYPSWPALLDDLLPAGESRTWWLNYLNVSRSSEFAQNYALLTKACIAPIGNLRIKEAAEQIEYNTSRRFSIDSVVELQHDFLEYANEHGAAVGGATGAGGVALKLLLMVDDNQALLAYLQNLAALLIELPSLLKKLNCPDEILNFPAIGFHHVQQKLMNYGVYNA